MARVTVEDCLKNVKNRFELVIVAAQRARQLMRGKDPKVEWDNDKPTVVALREIAAGFTNVHNVNSTETQEEHTPHVVHQADEKHEAAHDENSQEDLHEETHEESHEASAEASTEPPTTPTEE